ncbi:MAG: N-6 DNA methylase [Sedimentisphaerales bacterium]
MLIASKTRNTETDLFTAHELSKPKRLIYKASLRQINNLKFIFRDIRDYCAGNVTGISRDEKIAQNIMRLLFCKIFDEKAKHDNELVDFANRPNENLQEFGDRITKLFTNAKTKYPDIFPDEESIELPITDLSLIVSKFEEYSIISTDRDVIADAFEELIGTTFRGGEGQFFTPRNVVQMMIDVLQPKSNERILDPACGSGGFLAYILKYLIKHNASGYNIIGIDKDLFLSKLAKVYLTLIGEENYHIFCENSLEEPSKWEDTTQKVISLNSFDLILTNPPFGAKIPVVGRDLLRQFKLGHKWDYSDKWEITPTLLDKQPPQVLFIERCLQLLNDKGRMGIVLPEGIFGNSSDRYIWEFINQNATIIGVVSLPQETFQPSTHTKTSVLFLEKGKSRPKTLFMAIPIAAGHNKNGKETYKMNPDGSFIFDSQGNKILDDDLPLVAERFQKHLKGELEDITHLGFSQDYTTLSDHIFIPEYYNPEIKKDLLTLQKSGKYQLVTIGELIDKSILQIRRGNEIGSQFYGTGDIPFVRTTDIVNWEMKIDPVKAVAEEIYDQYKKQQDVRENDILFVNDGTFLIGKTTIITKFDIRIILQSHLKKIRVLDDKILNPFYLLYLLNTKIVRRQIDSKTFVQATLSTLGDRLTEIVLPISTDKKIINKITKEMKDLIEQKMILRQKTLNLIENSI